MIGCRLSLHIARRQLFLIIWLPSMISVCVYRVLSQRDEENSL